MTEKLIWSVKTGKLFSEIFQLPVNGQLEELLAKIEQQCDSPDLGSSTESLDEEVLAQRLVEREGTELIFNESNAGQPLVSIRAARSADSESKFRCKLMLFMHEKPTEAIEGVLTVSRSAEMPAVFAAFSNEIGNTVSASAESTIESQNKTVEIIGKDAFDFSKVLAVVGGLSAISVLFGFYFKFRMKRTTL